MTTNIQELTKKILEGFRLKRGDDLSFFLTAPLEELQHGAYALRSTSAASTSISVPSSTGVAAIAAKTAATARNRLITMRKSTSIRSCRSLKFLRTRASIRKPVPTALRL